MKSVLVALATVAALAVVAGPASAMQPLTACSMLKAADYKQVLGKPVKMSSGEGTASCNVFIGANPNSASLWIIPNLNPYDARNATYLKGSSAAHRRTAARSRSTRSSARSVPCSASPAAAR